MSDTIPQDAPPDNWVAYLPRATRPYARIMRLDRPIGIWLLLFPCLWSLALAALSRGQWPPLYLLILFAIGAVIMRGAGCVYNDIIDRKLDAQVARTKTRPLPSGDISLAQAWALLFVLCFLGLLILLQLDIAAIALGFLSIGLIALYPFIKRISWWPQIFLGVTFNWGALMGYASYTGTLNIEAVVLYAACICWTFGYDTIYAHQDREDDALIGIKSSARRLGGKTHSVLWGAYSLAACGLVAAFALGGLTMASLMATALACLHLFWQIKRLDIDNARQCLYLFRSNREFGILVLLALALSY